MVWFGMLLASVGVAQALGPSASEEATLREAKALHDIGLNLYETGRYVEALAAFEAAYEVSDNKVILYNMANVQERLGDLEGAIESLRTYAPFAHGSRARAIRLRIEALQQRIDAAPSASVSARPPPPEPSPDVPRARFGPRPRWGLVAMGTTLAAGFGAAAAVTYLEGVDARDVPDPSRYRRSQILNNVALSLAGVGGGLAVIGLAAPRKQPLRVTATPAGATVTFRF